MKSLSGKIISIAGCMLLAILIVVINGVIANKHSDQKTIELPKMTSENFSDPVGIPAQSRSKYEQDSMSMLWGGKKGGEIPKIDGNIYLTQFFEIPSNKNENVKNRNVIINVGQIYTPDCNKEKTCQTHINMVFSEKNKDGKFSNPVQKIYDIKVGKITKECRLFFEGTETPILECPTDAYP